MGISLIELISDSNFLWCPNEDLLNRSVWMKLFKSQVFRLLKFIAFLFSNYQINIIVRKPDGKNEQ